MKDDFRYKALENMLSKKGVFGIDYCLLEVPSSHWDADAFYKFKFQNYTFYKCACFSDDIYSYECNILEYIDDDYEDFLNNKPHINDYYHFIHFQLLGKTFFDLGYRAHLIGEYIDILTKEIMKQYPNPEDFLMNVDNVDISSLINNSEVYVY